MRTERIELIPTKIVTWKCDFCETFTDDNRGCCGSSTIMTCSTCGKHMCYGHRYYYQEDSSSDYPDVVICPECNPKFKESWEYVVETADRHDDITEIAIEQFENPK